MGARESECQISQNYILHIKFPEFNCVLFNLRFIFPNLTFIFSDYHEKCFWILLQIANYVFSI